VLRIINYSPNTDKVLAIDILLKVFGNYILEKLSASTFTANIVPASEIHTAAIVVLMVESK
jgi:hypothetical protein